jgi:hypothetical protein
MAMKRSLHLAPLSKLIGKLPICFTRRRGSRDDRFIGGDLLILLFVVVLAAVGLSCNFITGGLASPTATPTQPPPTGTKTPRPTLTPLPTSTPNYVATRQYEDLVALVDRYYDAGVLPSVLGRFYRIEDFSRSLAKKGNYEWVTRDGGVGNFIVRADVVMETADRPSSQSGCGFVFSDSGKETHDFVFLRQDGYASYGLSGLSLTNKYYGKLGNPAAFKMTLLVYENKLRLIVDDKEIIAYDNLVYVEGFKGLWGPAVLSGSNEDFGTRCDFANIEVWEVTP